MTLVQQINPDSQIFAVPFANTVAASIEQAGYGACSVHLIDKVGAEVWLGRLPVASFVLK